MAKKERMVSRRSSAAKAAVGELAENHEDGWPGKKNGVVGGMTRGRPYLVAGPLHCGCLGNPPLGSSERVEKCVKCETGNRALGTKVFGRSYHPKPPPLI